MNARWLHVLLGTAALAASAASPLACSGESFNISTSSSSGGGGGAGDGGGGSTASSSSGDGGGGATSSSSSSSGGAGGCASDADCPAPDPDGPCPVKAVCEGGVCATTHVAGPIAAQKYGDCKSVECDANGVVTSVDDVADVYDDGNECTKDLCSSGTPLNQPAAGTVCNNGYICGFLGNGSNQPQCLECNPADLSSCPSANTLCVQGQCVPLSCKDNVKSAGETDTDCGGPTCTPCDTGKLCAIGSDCWSGVCGGAPKKCQLPSCVDGLKNGTESDADCGGDACPACPPTYACVMPNDCDSHVCMGNVCQSPSCLDGEQNGDEAGVDCGGSACPACP